MKTVFIISTILSLVVLLNSCAHKNQSSAKSLPRPGTVWGG